jgi:hypothetical protein
MNPRIIYHVARADFLERTRSYGFLLTLAAMALIVYQTAQGHVVLQVDRYRGIFNSAWLGAMMALVTSVILSLVGLYLVKNTVARDERTRVGRVLAATPLSNLEYTLGKALSNFAVLVAMLAVLALGAALLQFTAGESRDFQLWPFVAPMIFIALPSLAFIAALAVLFENLPVMRSGAGNVIWFFLWTFLLAIGINKPGSDYTGMGVLIQPMQATVRALDPAGYKGGFSFSLGGNLTGETLRTFVWNGLDWTPAIIGARLIWIGVAAALVMLAALAFRRFDPARASGRSRLGMEKADKVAPVEETSALPVLRTVSALSAAQRSRSRFFGLVILELRLLLSGRKWWWYAVMAGCLIASFATPAAIVAPWIWPVTLWSQLGTREKQFGTSAMVFSAPSPARGQLFASYAGGVICAAVIGSAGFVHALIQTNAVAFGATFAGVCFVPALALALGAWTGSGKFFESLYAAWWYLGPVNAVPGLDFVGVSAASQTPVRFALLALGLLVAAMIGRSRQVAYPLAARS